jgi:hypothetical protein
MTRASPPKRSSRFASRPAAARPGEPSPAPSASARAPSPRAPREARNALAALVFLSLAVLAVRYGASDSVGFGDSEALYASYALHPAPAYLDHPGLIGLLARTIGGGTSPTPAQAHAVTSLLATLFPWVLAAACRACGATWRRSLWTAFVAALVPEIAVGLFAMTPDLPLSIAWAGALGAAAAGLRAPPASRAATGWLALAGVLAGVAVASKASGVLLVAGLGAAYFAKPARAHARTLAPWVGLVAAAVIAAPMVLYEARTGWPMVRHRLFDTQGGAGPSLRNVAALVGGQLAYVSPLVLVLAAFAARAAARGRRADAVGALLFWTFALPLAVLVPLCVWSRVAEPHWIAPALVALAPAAALADPPSSRRLVGAAGALAGAMAALVYAWVLVPSLVRLAPSSYDPRVDIANELRGWPEAMRAVRDEALASWTPGSERGDVVAVGPHWVVCAQLEAALRGDVPVGCDTPIRDDFDDWWPRDRWRRADTILWVTDERFPAAPALPDYATLRTRKVHVFRGGRPARVFTITVLMRRAQA